MFNLTEIEAHCLAGSERVSQSLAGEKATGICMLRVSGLSPTEDTIEAGERFRGLSERVCV